MTTYTLVEQEALPVIPDGSRLNAVVERAEERESFFKNDDGTVRYEVSFLFKITETGEWNGTKVFGNTPTTFSTHPDCKLRAWVQEILGGDDLPVGFELNIDDLVGMPVRIVTGVRARKDKNGKVVSEKHYVQDVMAALDEDIEPF